MPGRARPIERADVVQALIAVRKVRFEEQALVRGQPAERVEQVWPEACRGDRAYPGGDCMIAVPQPAIASGPVCRSAWR